ncbi:flagellar basal body-associated FliL family protein [Nocardioides sp. URHA0020]|uniref:flagellar basal body-associated FliL family protein n=1 Tax=Nocardioides sp. URHA0020 TaxID=1380392 RepID=UPI00048B358D|nr:flagellar basal body-associated FliL family protein [Nocardioides sp. URHA0020]
MATKTADKAEDKAEGTEEEGGSRGILKKVLILVGVLVVVAGAAWFFVLKPSPPKKIEPGEIVTLDSTQVNLAGGHYLRLGLALQLTTDAVADDVDGSKALDAAIDMFSGRKMANLSQPARRDELKEKLADKLKESYEGEVMDVYFTEFVTQ